MSAAKRPPRDIELVSRVKVGNGLVIAGASLIDGLIGVFTLGAFIGTLRHRASFWAARRHSQRTKGEGK